MKTMRDNHYGKGLITTEKMGCGNETAQMAISSYLDGEATGLEKTLAEWHLAECRECSRMLNRWSLNAGLLRQSARDPEMDRLAAAIAGQTRQWLWNDLLAAPSAAAPAPLELARLRPAPRLDSARFRPLKSSFVAAMMVVITILGISLGTMLSGPNFQSTPAVATIDRAEYPVPPSPLVLEKTTTNLNSNPNSNPKPGSLLATVTPATPPPSVAMFYSAASQTMAPQLVGGTPLLGYATPYTALTPGVGRGDGGKGN